MSPPRIGVMPLARATFDVAFAEKTAAKTFATLEQLDAEVVGPRRLLFDAAAAGEAIATLRHEPLDLLLVLQVTFTDATMTVALAEAISARLALWAFPEPRTGGRLRLNSFCGINLAGHALGKAGRRYDWLYRAPDEPEVTRELTDILVGRSRSSVPAQLAEDPGDEARHRAAEIRNRLDRSRLGLIGQHPDGFHTSEYDPARLAELTGVVVERFELPALFASAAAVPNERTAALRTRVAEALDGVEDIDPESLDKSLRLHAALEDLRGEHKLGGVATRCWPECFTEYGSAVCTPMAMLNEGGTPGACEADVYGNVTMLILQWLAGEPAFLADLVDLDVNSDTGVFWHCGLAPLHMADPKVTPRAAVHSNRLMPLLNEFPLKPGRVTIARLSQAQGRHQLVVGGGEMVRAPLSFSGTSGVVRFDRPAGEVLDTLMGAGLEHHYGLVYGDVRAELRALSRELDVPIVDLG
jgi:L-fucose isomerase-like protein